MIWIIASIPFWLLALALFVMAAATICMAFDTKYLTAEGILHKRNGYALFGAFVCLPASGSVALLAAKICS